MGLKVAIIGGGSSYTPELFENLFDSGLDFDVEQVWLQDINIDKQALTLSVCQQLVNRAKRRVKIVATANQQDAIEGADFVILQMRVGGLAARVRDETIPMEFGMVGNETTGAGGFSCALRTMPILIQIAHDVKQLAPDAWLLNLANPAGILTEALLKLGCVRAIGFCNIPINTTYDLAKLFNVSPQEIQMDCFGLNHLSWVRGVYVQGKERLQPLIAQIKDRRSILYRNGLVESLIHPDWLRSLNMLPSWYLRYYYYPSDVMDEARSRPYSDGQEDMNAEDKLRGIYTKIGYTQEARTILDSKGGSRYYLPVLQAIGSILNDRGEIMVVDVRNGVSLPDLPQEVCVEIPTRIYRDHAEPQVIGSMPASVRGLVQAVKAYEQLTIEAAISGQHEIAIHALVAHPLVGTIPKARAYFDRILETDRPYLTQF